MAAKRLARLIEKPASLVVANSLDVHPGGAGQGAHCKVAVHRPTN